MSVDNDTPGFAVSGISDNTTEAGGSATFTVALTARPALGSNVVLEIASSDNGTTAYDGNDPGEGSPNPSSLTFNYSNWNNPQTVTITGKDDNQLDGDTSVSYTHLTLPTIYSV